MSDTNYTSPPLCTPLTQPGVSTTKLFSGTFAAYRADRATPVTVGEHQSTHAAQHVSVTCTPRGKSMPIQSMMQTPVRG